MVARSKPLPDGWMDSGRGMYHENPRRTRVNPFPLDRLIGEYRENVRQTPSPLMGEVPAKRGMGVKSTP